MTRQKSILAQLAVVAMLAGIPAVQAQTVHVAGAGASSEFLTAAIGADSLALSLAGVGVPTYSSIANNCSVEGDASAVYHYTGKNAGYVVDTRSANINAENGNLWVVWVAACSDPSGATSVTDIWAVISVDDNIAVRSLLAQTTSPGAQLGVVTPPPSVGNLIKPATLFPDSAADVALPAAVYNAIGTGITAGTAGSDVHINLALSVGEPEDSLFNTTRALTAGNATLSGLGYRLITTNANFGTSILSGQPGSTLKATPENFSLSGGDDPITGLTVPAITKVSVGAAPAIFIYNNAGIGAGNYPTDLVSGVNGKGTAGGPYLAANLFDGTTACSTSNPAFNGFSGPVVNVNLVLREPISGAENVVEYGLFRTTGNTSDSQEKGISGAGALSHSPINPVASLACASGGSRSRAISTSEVVTAVDTQPNALGYIFYSFSNAAKFAGGANYNYLTLDGVDPLGGIGGANQTLPNCAGPCTAALWPGNVSYPTLRNGTYPLWSIFRYLYYSSNTDPVGPGALALAAENSVDTPDADFVPFYTASGGIGGVSDGLSVYHSHFTDTLPLGSCGSGCKSVVGKNGAATTANATNGGNTLGGPTETGGDMGGVIEGPFGIDEHFVGTVTTTKTLTAGKGYKVTHTGTNGPTDEDFVAGTSWEGLTINLNGTPYTIANVPLTATILYVTTNPGTATGVAYTATAPAALAVAPGTLNKKR